MVVTVTFPRSARPACRRARRVHAQSQPARRCLSAWPGVACENRRCWESPVHYRPRTRGTHVFDQPALIFRDEKTPTPRWQQKILFRQIREPQVFRHAVMRSAVHTRLLGDAPDHRGVHASLMPQQFMAHHTHRDTAAVQSGQLFSGDRYCSVSPAVCAERAQAWPASSRRSVARRAWLSGPALPVVPCPQDLETLVWILPGILFVE
jgi:hypothetical protein